MKTLILLLALVQLPAMPKPEDFAPVISGTESGQAKIPRHWWDFHKSRPGIVEIKLHADLRAPLYWVYDLTDPKADFWVIDPSYAHADHFQIKGTKGHRFSWKVAGRQ